MSPASDAQVLQRLGSAPDRILGEGGESVVYAAGNDRVLRVHRPPTTRMQVDARTELLREIRDASTDAPFETPDVLEVIEIDDRIVTVERRLPGGPGHRSLAALPGERREELVRNHLDAAAAIRTIRIDRPFFGDLMHPEPIRTDTFGEYLARRAAANLAGGDGPLASLDGAAIARDLDLEGARRLVHLDAFLDNMLVDGTTITAVIDFGTVSVMGDARLDPLLAAAYLDVEITPVATDADRAVAASWLSEHGLDGLYPAARRWAAAYWAGVGTHDLALYGWCASILSGEATKPPA